MQNANHGDGARRGRAKGEPRPLLCRLSAVLVAVLLVAGFNVLLYSRDTSGHLEPNSYAVIRETSLGAYRGVIGSVDFSNPAFGTGILTYASLWAVKANTCGNLSWVEVGWSKRANWPGHPEWAGQARHKFMHRVPPNCVFTIWPFSIGAPSVGPFYEYRLIYNSSNNRWEYFVDGAIKAAVIANWNSASYLQVGGELGPSLNGTVYMGPTNSQDLRYRRVDGTEVSFEYFDDIHCDVNPPLNPYNLIFPVSAPDWTYVWGPAAGGYCGEGAP